MIMENAKYNTTHSPVENIPFCEYNILMPSDEYLLSTDIDSGTYVSGLSPPTHINDIKIISSPFETPTYESTLETSE